MSRNHRTGQSGKGRPTPPRPNRGPKGRSTPSRSSTSVRGARKGPVYRQRRYPALPTALKLALALVWLAALAATIRLVEPWTGRVGVMIVVTMVLVLFVVLVFNPSRRSGRR